MSSHCERISVSEYVLQTFRKLHFPFPAFSASRASPLANSSRLWSKQRKPAHTSGSISKLGYWLMDPSPFLLWCWSYQPSKSKSPINGLCNCPSLCQVPSFPPAQSGKKPFPLEFLLLGLCLQVLVLFPIMFLFLKKKNQIFATDFMPKPQATQIYAIAFIT